MRTWPDVSADAAVLPDGIDGQLAERRDVPAAVRIAAGIGIVRTHRHRRDQVRVAERNEALAGEYAFACRRGRLIDARAVEAQCAERCEGAMQQRGQRVVRIVARVEAPHDDAAVEPLGISRIGARGARGFRSLHDVLSPRQGDRSVVSVARPLQEKMS